MEGVVSHQYVDRDILEKGLLEKAENQQNGYGFQRNMKGDFEAVSYLPGSNIRVWINEETTNYSLHWHPEIEMIVPVDNGYTVNINQKQYNLKSGDILIIPSGALHELIAPSSGRRLIFLFDINQISKISGFSYWFSFFANPVLISNESTSGIYPEARHTINQLLKDYLENDTLRDILFFSDIMKLFSIYVAHCTANQPKESELLEGTGISKKAMARFNLVFDYISDHLDENLSLETVANIAGFSKFHFSRLFKSYSGYNFYDYLSLQRIKAAEKLLYNSALSITDIALQCGFESLTTFNRTFKKIKNCTPTQYRKLLGCS